MQSPITAIQMDAPSNRLPAKDLLPLVQRLLESETDVIRENREHGVCFFCRGGMGRETFPARLFAVVVDGGLLLRLETEVRDRAIEAGVAQPNSVLPKWVLAPPQEDDAAGKPGKDGHEFDARIHGDHREWVWVPVADHAVLERRKPHLLEALAYGRHDAQVSLTRKRDREEKDDS